MVSIKYVGRTGNNLFQYAFALLLARANGKHVVTEWCAPDFVRWEEVHPADKIYLGKPRPDADVIDLLAAPVRDASEWLTPGKYSEYRQVNLRGYFQYACLYEKPETREFIKSKVCAGLEPITGKYKNGVVMHARLDDYVRTKQRPVIHPIWYYTIAKTLGVDHERIHLVVQEPREDWEREWVKMFKSMLPTTQVVSSASAIDDFNFIRQFGTQVLSNSSYAWWAAYLSEAHTVRTFSQWMTNCPTVTLAHTQLEGWSEFPGTYYFA